MVELVDAPDSKSGTRDGVRVRFSLPAPLVLSRLTDNFLFKIKPQKYFFSESLGHFRDTALHKPTIFSLLPDIVTSHLLWFLANF